MDITVVISSQTTATAPLPSTLYVDELLKLYLRISFREIISVLVNNHSFMVSVRTPKRKKHTKFEELAGSVQNEMAGNEQIQGFIT